MRPAFPPVEVFLKSGFLLTKLSRSHWFQAGMLRPGWFRSVICSFVFWSICRSLRIMRIDWVAMWKGMTNCIGQNQNERKRTTKANKITTDLLCLCFWLNATMLVDALSELRWWSIFIYKRNCHCCRITLKNRISLVLSSKEYEYIDDLCLPGQLPGPQQ